MDASAQAGAIPRLFLFLLIPIAIVCLAFRADVDAGWRARAKQQARATWAQQTQVYQTSRAAAANVANQCGNPSCPQGCDETCVCDPVVSKPGTSSKVVENRQKATPARLTASTFDLFDTDPGTITSGGGVVTTGVVPTFVSVGDFNPMWTGDEHANAGREVTSYAKAYQSGGEFVLVIGPESVANTLLDVVSCPVAREEAVANKPPGIYRVFDGAGGKLITPWVSTDDVAADRYQVPPATKGVQWQKVCSPTGCRWIQVQ